MAYITYEQYTELYGIPAFNSAEFMQYATLASDLIDSVTRHRIEKAGGIAALPPIVQSLVEKATAAQILYFQQLGLDAVMSGQTGAGFTVGKVHVDGSKGSETAAQMSISPLVKVYLEQSGLMGRGIPCLDPYRNGFYGTW